LITEPLNELPELLLLPGMDGTGKLFEPLVNTLSDKIQTRIVSYPTDQALGYDELLPYVTACFPKEKPFVILGESFSGPLATMAGAGRPSNLVGIVLAASFVMNPLAGIIQKLQWVTSTPLIYLRPRKVLVNFLVGGRYDPGKKSWIIKNLPKMDTVVLRHRIREVLNVNVRKELKGSDVPILYIGGATDRLVGKGALDAIWLCRPDVQVKILDTGHMVLQTKPVEASEAIIEFCANCLTLPHSDKLSAGS
jgi:pimeloyl-ACP methyl ester carboxylesterase